jgi:hypothetical protein
MSIVFHVWLERFVSSVVTEKAFYRRLEATPVPRCRSGRVTGCIYVRRDGTSEGVPEFHTGWSSTRGLRKPVRTTREGIWFLQLYSIISVRFPVTRAQARGREIEANSLIDARCCRERASCYQ